MTVRGLFEDMGLVVLFEERYEVFQGGGGFEIRQGEAEGGFEGGNEFHLFEASAGGKFVDGVDLGEGVELRRDERLAVGCRAEDEVLSQTDQVIEAGVGVIELAGGEFGVVSLVDTFVSEGRAELEDLVYAAYYEALEPEFGGDAHGEGFG